MGVYKAIKEQHGRVALDYAAEAYALRCKADGAPTYTLPDGRSKPPVATGNLLENTDGVGAPHHCSHGVAPCYLLIYADARYIDAVICFAGRVITLQNEHLRQAEALFQPALAGCRGHGLADILWETIQVCDADREGGPLRGLYF